MLKLTRSDGESIYAFRLDEPVLKLILIDHDDSDPSLLWKLGSHESTERLEKYKPKNIPTEDISDEPWFQITYGGNIEVNDFKLDILPKRDVFVLRSELIIPDMGEVYEALNENREYRASYTLMKELKRRKESSRR